MAEDNQFPLLDVVRKIPKQATFLDIVGEIGRERRAEALPGSANEPAGELVGATLASGLTPFAYQSFAEGATASIMKLFNMDGADLAAQYVTIRNRDRAETGGVRDSFGRSLAGMVTATVRGATAMESKVTNDYLDSDPIEGFARGMGTGTTMRSDATSDKIVSAMTQGVGNIAIAVTPGLNLAAVPLFFLQGAGGGANEYDQAFVNNELVDKSGKYNALNKYRAAVKGGAIESFTEWVGGKAAVKIAKTFWGASAKQAIKDMNPAYRYAAGTGLAYLAEAGEEGFGSLVYSSTKWASGQESPKLGNAVNDAIADAFYGGFGGAGAHPFVGIIENGNEKIMRNRISESIRNSNNAFSDPEFWDRMPQATVDSLRTMTPDERAVELETARATHQQADLDRQVGADNLNKASLDLETTQKALSKAERSKNADKITAATEAAKIAQDNYDAAFNAQAILAAELVSARTRLFTIAAFNGRNAPTVEADAASVLKGEKKTLAAASTKADEAAATELRNLGYDIEFFTPDSADNSDPAFYHPATPNTVYLRSGLEQGDIAKVMGFAYHEVMHIVQATDGKLYNALRASFDEVSTVEAGAQYFNDAMRADDRLAQNANAALQADLEGQATQPMTQEGTLVQRAGRSLLTAEGEARNLEDGIRELFRTGKAPGFLGKLIVRMGLRGRQAATALRVRSLLLASAEKRIAARSGAKPALTETGLQIEEAKGVAREVAMMQETAAPAADATAAPAPSPAPSPVPGAPAAPGATAAPAAPSAPPEPTAPKAGTVSGLSPADAALAGTPGFTAMVDLAAERIRKSQPKWAEGKPLYKIAERMEREPALLSPQEQQIGNKLRNEMAKAFGPDYTSLWARARSDTNRGRRLVADAIKELKLTEEEVKSTVLDFMTGKSKQESFVPQEVGGIPDTVKWLHERRLASGLPKFDLTLEEDREALSRLLAVEALAAIRSAGDAIEWYDKTIRNTIAQAAIKFPELNTDPKARLAFLMAVAISSQALNVEVNLAFATKQYAAYRKTVSKKTGYGQFQVKGKGKNADAQRKNFKLANKMLAKVGPEKLIRFLRTQFTAGQLNKAGLKVGGELQTELVLGSAIFGPKIGFGFLSNLDGNYDPVTMDMWFMRLVGRLSGTLPAFNPKTFAKQVKRFRTGLYAVGRDGVYSKEFSKKMVAAAKNEKRGDGPVIALAREVLKFHEKDFKANRPAYKSGKRVQSEMVRAAKTIIKSFDKPRDSPKSGGERRILRDVVRRSVEKLNALHGSPVPNAAFQALVWYPEQELYKSLGVKLTVTSQDYSGAMRKMLLKEGFKNEELDAAISTAESRSRKAQQVARKSVGRANGRDGGGAGRTRGLGEQSKADFLANAGTYARIRPGVGGKLLETTSTKIVDKVVSVGGKFAEIVKVLNESILDSQEALNLTSKTPDGKTREDRGVTVLVYPKVRANYNVLGFSITLQENQVPPSLLGINVDANGDSTELMAAARPDKEYVFAHELLHAATATKLYAYEAAFLEEESARLGYGQFTGQKSDFEKKTKFSDKAGKAYISALESWSANPRVDPAIKELIDCFLESAKAFPDQFRIMTQGRQGPSMITYTGDPSLVTVQERPSTTAVQVFNQDKKEFEQQIVPSVVYDIMVNGKQLSSSTSKSTANAMAEILRKGKEFAFGEVFKYAPFNKDIVTEPNAPFKYRTTTKGQGSVNKRSSGDEMVSRGALYQFGNLDEFLAGAISDARFQGMLSKLPSKGRGQSVFQRLVTAIRNLLGIPAQLNSMLTDVVTLADEIASTPTTDMKSGRRPVVGGENAGGGFKQILKFGFPIKGFISAINKSAGRSNSADNPAYNGSQLYDINIIGETNGGMGFSTVAVFKGDDGQWRLDTDTYSDFQWDETAFDTGESLGFDQPLGKTKEQAIDKILEFHDKWTDYLVAKTSTKIDFTDQDYIDAVNFGVAPPQQRMVDAAAKSAGFSTEKYLHTTRSVFQNFKTPNEFSSGLNGLGIWVAKDKRLTDAIEAEQSETAAMRGDAIGLPRLLNVYIREMKNPLRVKTREDLEFLNPNNQPALDIKEQLIADGFDGIIVEDDYGFGESRVVFDANDIGLSDRIVRDQLGNVVPLSKRFNAAAPKAKFAPLSARSRKTDADYIAAVESGDMETAQRMVDEAAKAAGFNETGTHGLSEGQLEGNTFDKQRLGSNTGAKSASLGFFFGSKMTALAYAKPKMSEDIQRQYAVKLQSKWNELTTRIPKKRLRSFLDMPGTFQDELRRGKDAFFATTDYIDPITNEPAASLLEHYASINESLNWVYEDIEQMGVDRLSKYFENTWLPKFGELLDEAFIASTESALVNVRLKMNNPYVYDYKGARYREKSYASILSKAKKNGHDSVILKNTYDGPTLDDIKVVFDSSQIKSADPVTRDESGEVIPLSERFDSGSMNVMRARERGPTGERADDAARAILDTARSRLADAIATKDKDKIIAARKEMMSAVRGLRRKVTKIDPLGLASEMGRRSGQAAGVAKGRVEGVREEAKKQRAIAVASRNELRSKFKSRVAQLFDRIEAAAEKNDELRNRMRIMKKYEGLNKEVAAEKAARRVLKAWFAGQQKGSAIGAKSERAEMISLRKEAAMAIASLPPSMRGKYINAVATMRTPSGIARVARRVVRDLALAESIETVSDINRMIKRVKKVGLRAETRKDILRDLMAARGLLAAGRKRMLPFTNTADVAARTLAAQQLLESARNEYDVERAEYRDIRDERAVEAELDAAAFSNTMSVLPSVEQGRLSSVAPKRGLVADILANYSNADIYTLMQVIEGGANGVLGKIWNTISTAKGNMIKERRSIDKEIDGYLRAAGYDGYDGYATTAAGLYGESSAEAIDVTLGGKPHTITMDQLLHLAAFDTSTVALLTDERQGPDVKGAPIVFGTYRDAKPIYFTRQEFANIRASLTADQIALIDNMKSVLENRIRPNVFEIYFQIHGRQPNMEDNYFPRKRLSDEVGDGAIDVNSAPSAIVGGMLANAGFMRNREASRATLVVGGMMRIMDDHVEESLRLVYLSLPLRYSLKVLKNVGVRSEIARTMGADANDSIRKLVLNGVGLSGKPVGGFVEAVNTNVSGALITLNPKTWLRQSGGVARLVSEFPAESWANGVGRMTAMTPAARKQLAIEIEEINGYFYDRHRRSQVGIFANVLGSESASKDRWANALRSSARSLSMIGEDVAAGQFNRAARDIREAVIPISKVMKSADGVLRTIDRQIMISAYLAALDSVRRSSPTMPVAEQNIAAAKLAENAFRKTQNVSDPLDDTVYAARQKFSQGLGRLMFPFSSDPLKGYNQIRRAIASRDPFVITRTAAGVAGNVTTSLAVNVLWSAAGIAIAQAVGGGSGDEDDDEMIAQMARERQYNNLLPNLAQDVGPLAFGYLGSAAGAIIEGAIGSPERADDVLEPLVIRFLGDTTQYLAKGQIRSSTSTALQMLGVPVVAPFSTVSSVAREANPGDTKLLKRYRELNKAGTLNAAQRVRMEVLAQRERIRLNAERIAKEMEAAR